MSTSLHASVPPLALGGGLTGSTGGGAMGSVDPFSAKRINAIINAPIVSLSRAGRNDAGHRRSKGGAHPQTSRIASTTGESAPGGIASVHAVIDTGRNEQRKLHRGAGAAASMLEIDLGALGTADGQGGGGPDGAAGGGSVPRGELCSSPRPHPAVEAQRIKEYESHRMETFEELKLSVPELPVYDAEGASLDLSEGFAWRAASARLPATATAVLAASDPDHQQQPHGGDESGVSPHHLHADVTRGNLAALLARQDAEVKVPLRPTAAFISPERWREPRQVPGNVMPPVGHYYPKYRSTHRRDSAGGFIPPLAEPVITPRGVAQSKKAALPTAPGSPLSTTQPTKAAVEAQMNATQASQQLLNTTHASVGGADGGHHEGDAAAVAPNPHMYVFKSRVPRLPTYQAPHDDYIWPRGNDLTAKASSPTKAVDMSRQVGRSEAAAFQPQKGLGPTGSYNPRDDPHYGTFSPTKTTDFSKSVPRKPPGAPPGGNSGPISARVNHSGQAVLLPLDTTKMDQFKYQRQPDVRFDQSSPRNTTLSSYGKLTKDIEVPSELPIIQYHSPRVVDIGRGAARPAPQTARDLHYEVDPGLTYHRVPAAKIRPDAKGHRDLFQKSEAAGCPTYDVDGALKAQVSKRLVRDVEFSKPSPRKEERSQLHDLDYEDGRHSPLVVSRVRGDPMIATQVSRAKRDEVASPVRNAPDVVYDVSQIEKVLPRRPTGNHDFSHQVDRQHVFRGRGLPPLAVWEQEMKAQQSSQLSAQQKSSSGKKRNRRGVAAA